MNAIRPSPVKACPKRCTIIHNTTGQGVAMPAGTGAGPTWSSKLCRQQLASPMIVTARALMSFLNVTKYPPSLDYLLMTCGPALVALAALERVRAPSLLAPLQTLGRVPLFYYLLQWPYAHLAGLLLGALTGQSLTHFFRSPPDAFRLAHGFGFSLPVVYLVWVAGVLLLYLPCRAYARAKRRYRRWWMSYL